MSQVSGGRRRRRNEEQSLEQELKLQAEELRRSEAALQEAERVSSKQGSGRVARLLDSDDESVALRNKLQTLRSTMNIHANRYRVPSTAQPTRRPRGEQAAYRSPSSSSTEEIRILQERVTKLEEENEQMRARQCACIIA
eukprot:TRINITY_DN9312_c4_g1_i1.p1 TRINITY_DN9312_c4_g1~~TRINITY_DN9312_c4_g1_i1.p1  ORF type:complete len:159 (+),score=19.58 TRINITY_DN9312_c4_g1_i1:60-479(+)